MKKLLLALTILAGIQSLQSMEKIPSLSHSHTHNLEHRNLIMIIDEPMGAKEPEKNDNLLIQSLATALASKVAPILISDSVWRDFAIARNNFNQKKNIPDTAEHIVYNQAYLLINEELNKLSSQYGYNAIALANAITTNLSLFTTYTNTKNKTEKLIGKIDFNNQFIQEYICFGTPFEPTEWDIYTYEHGLYILIPHAYTNAIRKRYTKEFLQSLKFKDSKEKILENESALLGIKTNNLTKLTAIDAYTLPYEESKIQLDADQGLPMDALLITNRDIVISKNTPIIHPFTWNIYLLGHGNYYVVPMMQPIIDQTLYLMSYIRTQIAPLAGISHYINHQSLITQLELGIKEKQNKIIELDTKNLIEQAAEIGKHKEGLEEILVYIKNKEKHCKLIHSFIFKNPSLNIAGMPVNAFSKLLQFFNEQVDTSFLFYETCFAGGRNLLYPYLFEFDQPIQYNYTIASGTINDRMTHTMSALGNITPANIHIKGNTVQFMPFTSSINFKSFFEEIHTNQSLTKTLKNIHYETDSITNQTTAALKPVIRLPKSTTFYVDDIDQKIQKISNVLLNKTKLHEIMNIDGEKKSHLVLNTYFIPTPIYFEKKLPLSIVSSIYESNLYKSSIGANGTYFRSILIDSSLFKLADILLHGSLSMEVKDKREQTYNPIPRLFICDFIYDNTFGADKKMIYKKVFLFNNIVLPESITQVAPAPKTDICATGMLFEYNDKSFIDAYITIIDATQGTITKKKILDKLPKNAITDYNNLFNETREELIIKACNDNLIVTPLQDLQATLEGPVREIAALRNDTHNLAQLVAEKTSTVLPQLSDFTEISDMANNSLETITATLTSVLHHIRNNPESVENKASAIRYATFGIRTALDTLYNALEAGLKQLRSNKEDDVTKEIDQWNNLLRQGQALKRKNADILMRLS